MDKLAFVSQIEAALDKEGIIVDADKVQQLSHFLSLLCFYNKGTNLTQVAPEDMVDRHMVDSLKLLPYLKGESALDVGSGPGLPGMILAIVAPHMRFTLLDGNTKRTDFCRIAKSTIGLGNVEVVCARVQEYSAPRFDIIVSRAFAELGEFLRLTEHLAGPGTTYLAMKGRLDEQELAAVQAFGPEVIRLEVPGVDQRHLVRIKK